ncbi:MAG: hypothetical protein LBG20_03860, partial [Holosporaceae bacterium]|nr:hypothetical protein [Holosporaceae bacterium]
MKILQKIAMIVMVVSLNVVAMDRQQSSVLDLPASTPGLQGESPYEGFVHVIVPGTEAEKCFETRRIFKLPFISLREKYVTLAYKNGYMCFPVDGHQPNTRQAALWSCANAGTHMTLEQRLASPVTEWYIERFKSIIKFQTSGEKQEVFWNMFREIASDPVGRILLYRLLIEIYRVDIRGAGCTE